MNNSVPPYRRGGISMNGGPINPMRIGGWGFSLVAAGYVPKSRNLDASLLVGQLSSMLRDPFIAHRAELRRARFSSTANQRQGACGNGDDDSQGVPPHKHRFQS
jgi:hypothetical protein